MKVIKAFSNKHGKMMFLIRSASIKTPNDVPSNYFIAKEIKYGNESQLKIMFEKMIADNAIGVTPTHEEKIKMKFTVVDEQ